MSFVNGAIREPQNGWPVMTWSRSTADPLTDSAAAGVMAAFKAAEARGRSTTECYQVAVAAWCRTHPDHSKEYAARQAIQVIEHTSDRLSLRIRD